MSILSSRRRSLASSGINLRLVVICGILAVLNLGAWLWAFAAFRDHPALLGVALVVYGLGLRHAVDADHIAAIDSVTRKLMHMHQRPVAVGFFFALGHASIVIVAAGAVAVAASLLNGIDLIRGVSGIVSTVVSSTFLLLMAAMNVMVFLSLYRSYRRVRAGGAYVEADVDRLLNGRGVLARIFGPMFQLVTKSWHMFPMGILFGLGFDTATEVAMFGISAAQATQGLPLGAILVFPVLFAAGMCLVDTVDGVVMLGVYNWAFVNPVRRLFYNMSLTLLAATVAIVIGGIEALGLIGNHLVLAGGIWDPIVVLNGSFNSLGFLIIGVFVVAWGLSFLTSRTTGSRGSVRATRDA
jgi:nickel/cobalt transporter (NiCoT) family protein